MAFTAKDWKDFPDTTTPITAASLEDVEARLAAYTRDSLPTVNLKEDYGALGNGVQDERSRLQQALNDMIAAGGGEIVIPPGDYLIGTPGISTGPFQADVTIRGFGMGGGSVNTQTTRLFRNGAYPILTCTGTGQAEGQFIDALSLKYLAVDGMNQIATLLDLNRVANYNMEGVKLHTAQGMLMHGRQHWNTHWTNCHFNGGGRVTGDLPAVLLDEQTDGTGNPATNTVHFTACEFEGNNNTDVRLAGATWVCVGVLFANCKWERNNGGPCIHFKRATSSGVVGSYLYQDLALDCILHEGGGSNYIIGNGFAQNPAALNASVYLWKGDTVTVVGNTFKHSSGYSIRLDTLFDTAAIGPNAHPNYGTGLAVNDLRNTKTGTIIADGQVRAYDGLMIKSNAGVPTDASMKQPPSTSGATLVWDDTNLRLYVRRPGGVYRRIDTLA